MEYFKDKTPTDQQFARPVAVQSPCIDGGRMQLKIKIMAQFHANEIYKVIFHLGLSLTSPKFHR